MFFDLYGGIVPDKAPYNEDVFKPYFEALAADGLEHAQSRDHSYFQSDDIASLVIDEVEGLWEPIAASDDWSAFEAKIEAIRRYGDMLSRYDS